MDIGVHQPNSTGGLVMNETWQDAGVSEHAGFPNAATDTALSSLDLSKLLIQRPISTFFMRVRGAAGEQFGIFDGDIVVVDRSLRPQKTDRVIWWSDESFAVSKPQAIPDGIIPWGVVTYVIHEMRTNHA